MIIREAIISDAFSIAKVHIDSWRTTYNLLLIKFVIFFILVLINCYYWCK